MSCSQLEEDQWWTSAATLEKRIFPVLPSNSPKCYPPTRDAKTLKELSQPQNFIFRLVLMRSGFQAALSSTEIDSLQSY